ncbi:2-amino-4-hydroxy-6-hydroxymethyldihydropteridine diphosphokinase [Paracidobacterium acidisoli]|uniref:2-amino-4-hydroxy-6-hydroxymethyldihydropteridine pyrophosphokinase n=1 Tax=Paracidobacterium acidisoli TaxID=2303751 RepID=A0A372ILL4_9BACT|nr:2-amino-4-hydroxy-6-hydroxymethyldihydropteridine diphosphokinase [Paracidobacterium acidisoli]MBT9332235.1 2-amino-4-hydroxy-6-hydroxymethyldihydropteridine diphosphokinase [Paracidobacterium acidisoli]
MQRTAYIGMGSNMASAAGDPAQTVAAAADALRGLGEVTARSSLYRTEPVGEVQQPAFINAVAELRTELEPERLLEELLQIERRFGRERSRSVLRGPRTLDLDLLMMEDVAMASETLTLPHPSIEVRRFVLAPLAEIAPELRHAPTGKTITELLAELPDTGQNARKSVTILREPDGS